MPMSSKGRFRRYGLAAGSLLITLSWASSSHANAVAGAAEIAVDARQAPRGIMSAHLVLPVVSGPLTLVYPKWLPGRHSPAGPLTSLGGPRFTANGRALSWRRDAVDMNAFSVDIPA